MLGLKYPLGVSAYGKSVSLGRYKVRAMKHRTPPLKGSSVRCLGTSCYKTAQPSWSEMHFSGFLWRHFRTRNTCSVLLRPHGRKARGTSSLQEVGPHLRSSSRHYQPNNRREQGGWLRQSAPSGTILTGSPPSCHEPTEADRWQVPLKSYSTNHI